MSGADNTTLPAVYADVISDCEPYRSEEPWSRFPDPGAYFCPSDPDHLLESLRQKYRAEDLLMWGVAVADGDDIALSPALLDRENPLVALRGRDGEPPFDILTRDGCISGRTPAVAVLDDVVAIGLTLHDPSIVHIVFTMQQLIAYRSLGLCAAISTGLVELSRDRIAELFRRLQPFDVDDDQATTGEGPAEAESGTQTAREQRSQYYWETGADQDWSLSFQNWSLDAPDGDYAGEISAMRDHFAKIEKHFARTLRDAFVTTPTLEAREALEFALQHGSRTDTRRALLAMGGRGEPLITRPVGVKKVFTPPGSLSGATSQLFETQRLQSDLTTRNRAWDNYQEALERSVLAPLRQEAEAEPDPAAKSLRLAFAGQVSLLHRQQAFVAGKMGPPTPGRFGEEPQGISMEDVEVTAKLAQGLVLLWKEIRRSPPRRPVIAATARTLRETTGNEASTDQNP